MSVGERTRSAVPVLSPILVVAGLLLVAGNLRAGLTTVGPVLDQIRADLGLTSV